MKQFSLKKHSSIPRDDLFRISTDIENFSSVMPEYFKSLSIIEESGKEKLVDEKISFLGKMINVQSKHVIIPPNVHEVHILTGPLKGTFFIEQYDKSDEGTDIQIDISLFLNGLMRFIPFLRNIIVRRMESVFSEFLICAEKFLKNAS